MLADRIAAGGLPAALGGARRLHIYGLTTLRARRRLFEALGAQRAVEVFVYLAHEEEAGEWEALAAEVEVLDDAPPPRPAVQPAPDGRREFEWIACKVKELLSAGACAPHEIAVVARTGRDDTRRAHEVLSAAGIPNTARIRCPFAEIPALKAVLALFRGAARGWTYRPLRHVLESAYFDLDVDLRAIDYIACQRRVEGLARWSVQLCRLQERVAAADDDWEYRKHGLALDRLRRDCKRFDAFRARAEKLSEARPLADWVTLTRSLLDPGWFDFRSRICHSDAGRRGAAAGESGGEGDGDGWRWAIVRLDQRGVERLDRLLRDWPELEPGAEPLELREWYVRLRRFLESNELALTTPLATGVQVLEAHEAALFPFKHSFVVHANDGEFPRRAPTGVILSEDERSALAARTGLPLTHRDLWHRRERALWRAVTRNPDVTITYRTADPNGVPLLPSLMIPQEAIDESREIPRTRYTWPVAFNRAQARRRAAARLAKVKKSGEAGPIRVAEPGALRHAVLAAYADSQRREGPSGSGREAGTLNPWNGELRDPWVLHYLERRFGDDRFWSASRLETYAECPFLFFIETVLRLQEMEEAEEATSPLTFGSVAHELLERFYPELLKGRFPGAYDEAAAQLFERVAQEAFDEMERDDSSWLGIPPLWAVTRRDLRQRVSEYLEWELPRFGDWRPHEFELEFGRDRVAEIEGLDLDGRPRRLRVIGRIDRVDVKGGGAGAGAVYRILDYKSKSVPAKTHYEQGVVQIPIYMKALAALTGGRVEYGGYCSIKDQKEAGQAEWGDPNFERAIRIAMTIPARVRAGKFEPQAAGALSRWPSYWPGLEVVRVKAILKGRCRFDE